jgi:hypothetical protein
VNHTFRDVIVTTLLCTAAYLFLLHRHERRHEREMRQASAYWRNALVAHCSRPAKSVLSAVEQAAFEGIAARYDSGLDILDAEGDQT